MKIDRSFVLREIAGEYIIIPTGKTALEFNGLITVNEIGMELWKMLQNDVTFEDLLNGIMEEYDVDEDVAKEDIQDFLDLPQFQGYTDLEFCEWMIKNIGVAAVPGSSFFKEEINNLIRLHFAREEKTLDEALARLSKLAALL